MDRSARAHVSEIRQTTQYTCCATSLTSALHALGKRLSEDDVNRVLDAAPMQGATWEAMLATVQYFGCRGTLVVPATPRMLKAWVDKGTPVIIAWNPEGRPWSHASTVFDVTEGPPEVLPDHCTIEGQGPGLYIWVMDSNIPNPSKTVRVVHEDSFCQRWGEKVSDSLIVRRPAMTVEREITVDGRQVKASGRIEWVPSQDGGVQFRDSELSASIAIDDFGDWVLQVLHRPSNTMYEAVFKTQRDAMTKAEQAVASIRRRQQPSWLHKERQANLMPKAAKTPTPVTEKKDPNKIKVDGPARRNPVTQQMIERGPGGAGKHHTRTRDVEKGHSRRPKHKKPWSERESANRVAEAYLHLTNNE